jgi:hemolysin-activating ACP:hemolysin acyltransferase
LTKEAINCGQYRIWRDENGPYAFCSWAWVPEERIDGLVAEGGIKPSEWSSGGEAWIVEMACPFGRVRECTNDLRRLFGPRRVWSRRLRNGKARKAWYYGV